MNKSEIGKLFSRIKNHYDVFSISEDKITEWHKFLKKYSSEDVNKRLDEYLTYDYDNPPLVATLVKGLKEIEAKSSWSTKCDICSKLITIYDNDMTDYEKHFRKCSKIDFIDRMSKRLRGQSVSKRKYYEMTDVALNDAYRKIMEFYLQNKDNDMNFIKKINEEEI